MNEVFQNIAEVQPTDKVKHFFKVYKDVPKRNLKEFKHNYTKVENSWLPIYEDVCFLNDLNKIYEYRKTTLGEIFNIEEANNIPALVVDSELDCGLFVIHDIITEDIPEFTNSKDLTLSERMLKGIENKLNNVEPGNISDYIDIHKEIDFHVELEAYKQLKSCRDVLTYIGCNVNRYNLAYLMEADKFQNTKRKDIDLYSYDLVKKISLDNFKNREEKGNIIYINGNQIVSRIDDNVNYGLQFIPNDLQSLPNGIYLLDSDLKVYKTIEL